MSRGRFISFEGGEGSGKTTHARRLADRLRQQGISVCLTREPGGSDGAEDIRHLLVSGETGRWTPMAEALLHTAARVDHVARQIEPALAEGQWVITDRFADSTVAYQGAAQGLGVDTMWSLHRLALNGIKPSLTVILDLPAELGLSRAGGRNGGEPGTAGSEDRYERMGYDFHQTLRKAFLEIAQQEPARCVVIDATATVDDVAEEVWNCVESRLLRQ